MAADGRVLVVAFAAHLVGMLAAAGLFVFILRGQPAGGHPDRGSGDDDGRGRGPAAARRLADVRAPARDGAAG